ncbi:MAG: HWE histidine kinase domain-containing protein [Pseudomonadota bacterium]
MNALATARELTECDREPIHQIAAVQPYGAFLQLDSDWTVRHRSLNCADVLGLAQLPAIGTNLKAIFQAAAIDTFRAALVRLAGAGELERLFGVQMTDGGRLYDCAVHAIEGSIVLEFEPHDSGEFVNHVSLIAPMLAQLESIKDTEALCAKAATLLREMLGYDRVMVYRFHADDSGEVIAEDARDDLESFLGLRYPQADIPQQARDLFRINRVRMIADVAAEPATIEPPVAFGNRPLDMSLSVLRASSPIHLKYLENMGVEASLTLALVRNNKLWGLIACHHMAPRLLSFSLRTVAETFSQMFSLILDRVLIDRSEQLRSRGRELHGRLMLNLAEGATLGENVKMVAETLDGLVAHDGLSVTVGGQFTSHGMAPSEKEFLAIAPELAKAELHEAYATTSLALEIPAASAFEQRAAGALFIPISRQPGDHLILWRKSLAQKVRWAGDPSKAKATAPGERLQPRESFAAWEQTVEGRSEAWSEDDLHIAEGLRVTLLEVILRMSEEVARERSRAQEQQGLLIAELNHRVRNILNLIRGLVSQSKHDALDVENFASIIGGRIAALASAHDNITQENWAPAPLTKLFESEIEAYVRGSEHRFSLVGEEVLIAPEAYTVLALVVHELMTNSAKYGSLCDRSGSVHVTISRTASDDLSIAWRERGGPPVRSPTRRGFGSTIIEKSIPFELKGQAELRFLLAGLEADFIVPQRYVTADPENTRAAQAEGDGVSHPSVAREADHLPRHALVVEDSMIIALDTEESLKRLGVGSVEIVSSVSGALGAIKAHRPDIAIVDFNLGQESSTEIIAELGRLNVPFALATGYTELDEEIGELGAMGVVRKPYGQSEIEDVIETYQTLMRNPGLVGGKPVSP